MVLNVANCPRCGKVYAKGLRDVCPACIREIDEEYTRCAEFLRENKGASIQEVSDEADVTINQITKFIREGRISLTDLPNLGIPCEMCGAPAGDNKLCENCRRRFSTGVEIATERAQKREEELKRALRSSYQIRDNEK